MSSRLERCDRDADQGLLDCCARAPASARRRYRPRPKHGSAKTAVRRPDHQHRRRLPPSSLSTLPLPVAHVVQPDGPARPASTPAGRLRRRLRPSPAGDSEGADRLAPRLGPRPYGQERCLPELEGPRCRCSRWQAAQGSSGEGWQGAESRGQSLGLLSRRRNEPRPSDRTMS